jgi:hypothetical protein
MVMLGMLLMPASTQSIADGDKGERLIATYGGYGIHYLILGDYRPISSWATLGDASVDIFITDKEATGVIILGNETYEVKLEKADADVVADGTSLTHKSIQDGILFEGDILNHDGEVRLIRYQDVVVGEIDLGEILYRFDVAGSLVSAGTILVRHNDEYVKKLIEMAILQLPEMPQPTPPVEPNEYDLHEIGHEPVFICPETQYVPSLRELLAGGDDVIPLLLVTEPLRIEELRALSELNEHVLTLVAAYTLGRIEEDKDIDEVIELLEGLVSAEDNGVYLEELEQLVGPVGGGSSSWRHIAVHSGADEEYRGYHGAGGWKTAIYEAIEDGDNLFEHQFLINFWHAKATQWDSYGGHNTLHLLFDEARQEVPVNRFIHPLMAAFTAQYPPPNQPAQAWGLAERGTTAHEAGTLGDNIIVTQDAGIRVWRVVWHEFSHIFGCTCSATEPHPHGCIMSERWWEATKWCTTGPNCDQVIAGNKWVPFM